MHWLLMKSQSDSCFLHYSSPTVWSSCASDNELANYSAFIKEMHLSWMPELVELVIYATGEE